MPGRTALLTAQAGRESLLSQRMGPVALMWELQITQGVSRNRREK